MPLTGIVTESVLRLSAPTAAVGTLSFLTAALCALLLVITTGCVVGSRLMSPKMRFVQRTFRGKQFQRKDGGNYLISHRATTPEGQKRKQTGGDPIETNATKGKLRLKRVDSTLFYSAEVNGKVEELYESELGTDDINTIRFAADNGGSPTLVDVRIKEITVQADEIGAATPLSPPNRPFAWQKIGLYLILILATASAGNWYWKSGCRKIGLN